MRKLLGITLVMIFLCASCKDFIEPSIRNEKVKLLAPSNLMESKSYQQTFWWEEVNDALKYRLQIVSPSFENTEKLILDDIVTTNKFTHTLDPGTYQWRVRAENGSSQTVFTTQSFTIYPSSLNEQSVQLQIPVNEYYSSNPAVTYQWLKLYGATQYRLQVDNNNFSNPASLVLDQVTDNLSYVHTFIAEGKYQYRVRAENATENSKWSAVRNLTFDGTPPAKVILNTPLDKQAVSKPVKLTWNAVTGADKYELIVYKNDGSTVFSATFPLELNATEYTFNSGVTGDELFWKVRAIDKAGNKGSYSNLFSFILQ